MFMFDRTPRPSSAHSRARKPSSQFSAQAALLQRKPTISSPGDHHEREADEVADKVMRMAEPSSRGTAANGRLPRFDFSRIALGAPPVQPAPIRSAPGDLLHRACTECAKEDDEKKVARAPRGPERSGAALDVGAAVRAAARGGQALPQSERSFFEPRFVRDFSRVRLHTDDAAARAAEGVQARAFTVGQDVVFGRNEYAPGTAEGRRLIAHELTHVVQQSSGAPESVQRALGDPVPQDDTPTPTADETQENDDDDIDDDEDDTEREQAPEPDEDDSDAQPMDAEPAGLWKPPSGRWILVKLPGTLYRFEGSKRISAWGISGGKTGHPTPQGTFKIGVRDEDHRSSKYGKCGKRKVSKGAASCKSGETYVGADMHYYQNFAPQVGFHRGSPRVASHGCIHVSAANAKELWKWASEGTTVIVCSGKACKTYLHPKAASSDASPAFEAPPEAPSTPSPP